MFKRRKTCVLAPLTLMSERNLTLSPEQTRSGKHLTWRPARDQIFSI
jgi:hypothetical protein